MKKLKEFEYDDVDFTNYSSQQFATVVFERKEDARNCLITIIQPKQNYRFLGNNDYNPSLRRRSTCVYVMEEGSNKVIKICTIQHKGHTYIEIYGVGPEELKYLKLDLSFKVEDNFKKH